MDISTGSRRPALSAVLIILAAVAAAGVATSCTNRDGAELYALSACPSCHRVDGSGSPKAPALDDLDRHWDEERLVRYFQNPKTVRSESERLQELSSRYPDAMAGAPTIDTDELEDLAEYVLQKWG